MGYELKDYDEGKVIDMKIWERENDVSKYLVSTMGKRFFLISDTTNGYVGLVDSLFPGAMMMYNTEMERKANMEIVNKARGDVLIAGLGIGFIILPIMRKKEVISIDIIEKHQEIIDMIKPQLPFNAKVNVINEDIMNFKPTKKYDIIFFDTIIGAARTEEDKKPRMIDGKFIEDDELSEYFKEYLKETGESLHWEPGDYWKDGK